MSNKLNAQISKLSVSEFEVIFNENEDNNMHSENLVLLAENFGTKKEIAAAKRILEKHEIIGSLPSYLMIERDYMLRNLYRRFLEVKGK